MAAPSFVAASTGSTDSTGPWTATCHAPAAAGNLIILQFLQDGNNASPPTVTSVTNIEKLDGTDGNMENLFGSGSQLVGGTGEARQWLFVGRSLSTSAPVVTGANAGGDDVYWRFYEFRDVSTGTTVATIAENITAANFLNSAGTTNTASDAAVTTLGPDRLALNFVAVNDDNAISAFTGETGGDWTLATAPYADSGGTDGAIALQKSWIGNSLTASGASTYELIYGGSGTFEQRAQSFTSAGGETLKGVRVYVAPTGSPTDGWTIELQSDASGLPSGAVLASATGVVGDYTALPDYTLAAGTYWIVFRRNGARDTSNYYSIQITDASSLAGAGTATRSSGTWGSASTRDFNMVLQFNSSTAATIDGGSGSIVDSDAWGVVGFALIGTTVSGPTEYFGAATTAYTGTFTSVGTHPSAGAVADALTATFTTAGARTVSGASAAALAGTFTTQGTVTTAPKTGAATADYTGTFTTVGTHPSAGAVVDALTATFTTAGIRTVYGASASAYTATFTSQGITTRYGATHGGITNLLSNGGFETNVTGWTVVGSTFTRDITDGYYGASHADLTTNNAAIGEGVYATFTATAAVHTVSVWLKDVQGTHSLRLAVRDNAGGNAQLGTPFSPPSGTTWTRYTFTTTALSAGTWRFYVETVGQQLADVDVDGAQAQVGSTATTYVETNDAPATRFGSLETVTAATRTRFGAATQDYTGTFTIQGTTTRFGAVVDDLAATFTTQGTSSAGSQTWFGATTSDYTATFTTLGTTERFGSSVVPFTGTFTTQGLGAHFGATTQDFLATFVTQGSVQGAQFGSVVAPLTLTSTTVGKVDAHAASSAVFTGTFTTLGFRTSAGASSQDFLATFTTLGSHTAFGASVAPFTATFVTAGVLDAHGVVADALTGTFTTQGFNSTTGASVVPFLATFTTQGAQSGQQFGAVVAPFAGTFTTQGRDLTQRGAVVAPFAETFTTQGFATRKGAVVLPFTGTFITLGARTKFGAVVDALTGTFTSVGVTTRSGQVVVTLSLGETTAGYATTQGVVVLPLTLALTSAGTLTTYGASVLPFTLDLTTAGAREFFGEVVLPFLLTVTTTPATLVLMAPIMGGHIGYAKAGRFEEQDRIRVATDDRGMVVSR